MKQNRNRCAEYSAIVGRNWQWVSHRALDSIFQPFVVLLSVMVSTITSCPSRLADRCIMAVPGVGPSTRVTVNTGGELGSAARTSSKIARRSSCDNRAAECGLGVGGGLLM